MPAFKRLIRLRKFMSMVGELKHVNRFKKNGGCKGDTTAEHTCILVNFVLRVGKELNQHASQTLDLMFAVELALVHDLPESLTGDVDAIVTANNHNLAMAKCNGEQEAMCYIAHLLPNDVIEDQLKLWREYQNPSTPEGFFVKAADKIVNQETLLAQGYKAFDDYGFIAVYGNKEVRNFPPLKPYFRLLKADLAAEFKKAGIPWKAHYNDY